VTPAIAGQASALRAAAAFIEREDLPGLRVTAFAGAVFIEVPRAAGSPAARTGLAARLAAAAGTDRIERRPGPWQKTVTAVGRIDGHRAVITTLVYDEEDEEKGTTA
jgi:hypothetical protein